MYYGMNVEDFQKTTAVILYLNEQDLNHVQISYIAQQLVRWNEQIITDLDKKNKKKVVEQPPLAILCPFCYSHTVPKKLHFVVTKQTHIICGVCRRTIKIEEAGGADGSTTHS